MTDFVDFVLAEQAKKDNQERERKIELYYPKLMYALDKLGIPENYWPLQINVKVDREYLSFCIDLTGLWVYFHVNTLKLEAAYLGESLTPLNSFKDFVYLIKAKSLKKRSLVEDFWGKSPRNTEFPYRILTS